MNAESQQVTTFSSGIVYTDAVGRGRGDEDSLESNLRAELSNLQAALAALPSRFFTERAPLLARRDEISDRVRRLAIAGSPVLDDWTARTASAPPDPQIPPRTP